MVEYGRYLNFSTTCIIIPCLKILMAWLEAIGERWHLQVAVARPPPDLDCNTFYIMPHTTTTAWCNTITVIQFIQFSNFVTQTQVTPQLFPGLACPNYLLQRPKPQIAEATDPPHGTQLSNVQFGISWDRTVGHRLFRGCFGAPHLLLRLNHRGLQEHHCFLGHFGSFGIHLGSGWKPIGW